MMAVQQAHKGPESAALRDRDRRTAAALPANVAVDGLSISDASVHDLSIALDDARIDATAGRFGLHDGAADDLKRRRNDGESIEFPNHNQTLPPKHGVNRRRLVVPLLRGSAADAR